MGSFSPLEDMLRFVPSNRSLYLSLSLSLRIRLTIVSLFTLRATLQIKLVKFSHPLRFYPQIFVSLSFSLFAHSAYNCIIVHIARDTTNQISQVFPSITFLSTDRCIYFALFHEQLFPAPYHRRRLFKMQPRSDLIPPPCFPSISL